MDIRSMMIRSMKTTDGICANQGIHCPYLYDPIEIAVYVAILLRPMLIIFILYLSIVKMKSQDLKVFVLNLYSWSIASDFFTTAHVITSIIALFNPSYETIWKSNDILFSCSCFVIWTCGLFLIIMTFFYVTTSYLSYQCPLHFRKYLAKRSWMIYYLIMHITPCIFSAIAIMTSLYCRNNRVYLPQTIAVAAYNSFAIFMILMTAGVTVKAVIVVRRCEPKRVDSNDIRKHRRRLISFLIFSIPFNFINFIVFSSMIITTVCALFQGGACTLVKSIDMLIFLFVQYRTILISVFILFGLKQCRDAMRELFARKTTKVTTVANNKIADVTAQFERQIIRDCQLWSYQAGGNYLNISSGFVRR